MTARDGKNNARKDAIRELQKANPGMTYLEAGKLLDKDPDLTVSYEKWRAQLGVDAENHPVWLDMQLLDGSDLALVKGGARTYEIGYVILKMLGDAWKSRGARVIGADVRERAWQAGFETVSVAAIPMLIDELEASIDPSKDPTDSLDGPQTVLLMTSEVISEVNNIRHEHHWSGESTNLQRLRGRNVRIAILVPDDNGSHHETSFFRYRGGRDWKYKESVGIRLLNSFYPAEGDKKVPILKGQFNPIVGASKEFWLPLNSELMPHGGRTIQVPMNQLLGTYLGHTKSNVSELEKQTLPGDIIKVIEADSLRFRLEGRPDPFRLELIHALASLKDRSVLFEVGDPRFVAAIKDIYPDIEANGIRLAV